MMRNKKIQGFTLIELLLGIGIFSIISLSLYTTFFNGIRLSDKTEQVNKIYREARWTIQQIEKDLGRVVLYDFSNSYSGKIPFEGDSTEVSVLIETGKGLKVIKYSLAQPDSGNIHKVLLGKRHKGNINIVNKRIVEEQIRLFVREELPIIDFLEGTGPKDYEILSSKILEGSLKFQYAKRDEENPKEIKWIDSWGEKAIPVGLRIQLTYVDQSNNSKLPLTRDMLITRGFWSKTKK